MSVVIGLGIFILGLVVGFIVNKLITSSSQEGQVLAEKAAQSEATLAQYKLDVAEHLSSSAALLEQMNKTCQVAMTQMSKSTELLQQVTPDLGESMPFFSQETQEELAQTVNQRKKSNTEEEAVTEAPLDYSGNPSGLFDSKQ